MTNLIIHRGLTSKSIKENTYLSISKALNHKYSKGSEFDVHLTKDNKIVVIHDHNINRTSNGTGLVEKLTLNELNQYNYGTKSFPQSIPTLKQILDITTNKILLIELKCYYNEKKFAYYLNELLMNYPESKNIYVMSFNKKIINYLNKLNSRIKLGYLIYLRKNINYNKFYNFILVELMNQKIADKIIKTKKEVFFYHINEKRDITKVKSLFPESYHSKLFFISDRIDFI